MGNSDVLSMCNDSINESDPVFDLIIYEPLTKHKRTTIIPQARDGTIFFLIL